MSKLMQAMRPAGEQPRPITPYERFRLQVNQVRTDIAGLVGERNVDKFVRVCLNAVQANPAVLEADRRSLLLSCLRAAQDGLLPDGREAVLNIFKTKVKDGGRDTWKELVQYMPMAFGLVQLIYSSGATMVDAVAVYEKDDFKYQRGDEPRIHHVPYDGEEEPGKVKAAYVVVKLHTGEVKREVMFRRDIERVRAKSKAKDGMMWEEFYDQAAIKSVIHRVVKQLPRSERLDTALAHDNQAVGLEGVEVPAENTGVNLEQLVDMRFEQEQRTVPSGQVVVDNTKAEAGSAGGSGGATEGSVPAGAGGGSGGQGTAAAVPKKGDPGTPEMKAKYLQVFKDTTDADVLDIKRDELNFYQWQPQDIGELQAAYQARRNELTAG